MSDRRREKRQRRLAAVVLARTNYGEADLIITFLTREMGLISALARYGRRSVRRFGGGLLSPGAAAWYDFTIKPNIDLAFVEKGEDNPKVERLPAEPVIQGLAAFALELVRGFETPGNPAEASFNLLVRHLGRLARCRSQTTARLVSLDFALKYMELAGFGPRFSGCLLCGSDPAVEKGWHWDPLAGGLYCPNCTPRGDRRVRPISRALLCRLSSDEPEPPHLGDRDLAEAELFFEKLAEHHLDRPLKAMKAVRRLLKDSDSNYGFFP
ncbi:DNA repair protein RecO [Deltaproteobacteria bacterium Smac51]|nr:DNA repair protein RecO [Deltaproteobacteria bacterium Smac51]